ATGAAGGGARGGGGGGAAGGAAPRPVRGEGLPVPRGVGVNPGRPAKAPVWEPYRAAVLQVDGREERDHAVTPAPTPASQRSRSARPPALDFSGWNCRPTTDPAPAAAATGAPRSTSASDSAGARGSQA